MTLTIENENAEEARTVRTLVQRVLAQPGRYPLNLKQRELVGGVDKRLADILDRGRVTDDERNWLVRTARLLLLTVF